MPFMVASRFVLTFATTALLSAGVELLSTHRDQLDRLMANPVGWPTAVEELLRFVALPVEWA
jgi:cytochrome P450